MVEVGEIVKLKNKSGNAVERKCVAVVDAKFIKEHNELMEKNGFSPLFVKDGAVWMAMTAPKRLIYTPEQREALKEKHQKEVKDRAEARANAKKGREAKKAKEKSDNAEKRKKEAIERAEKAKKEADLKLKELKGA